MTPKADILVLGAGIVGVSVALQLQMRGMKVALVDRNSPGAGTSYGNAGLIQDEAIMPYLFPRSFSELFRYARNQSIDASYDLSALPSLALPFFRYWRNSDTGRALAIAHNRAPLIRRSIADHMELADMAGASDLLRPIGWSKVFYTPKKLDQAVKDAEMQSRRFGVAFKAMNSQEVVGHEPDLKSGLAGGLHWPSPLSVSDPYALTTAYLDLFSRCGGRVHQGDGRSLEPASGGWTIATDAGPLSAAQVVVSMGPWSPVVFQTLGYSLPFFVMRGYHRHYGLRDGGRLGHPVLDAENGYFLVPMKQGVRLTTGAEFARRDAAPNPVQLERALPKARQLFPALGDALEAEPWVGARPCMPDMLPVIGPAPRHPGVWFAMGHAHHGLTLGPTTGKLLADLITGETPFTDPAPYSVNRFS